MQNTTATYRYSSPRGHRADAVAYPVNLGGATVYQYFCSECGFDLEAAPRGRWQHLQSRHGDAWLDNHSDEE